MEFLHRSLVAKLLTYALLLAMVPIAIIGYLAYDSGRQAIVDDVEAHLESVAILKEHEIQTWVESLEYSATWLTTTRRYCPWSARPWSWRGTMSPPPATAARLWTWCESGGQT